MRLRVAIAVCCLSMGGMVAAQGVQAAIKKQTVINAQGLGPALQLLARQRDVQVVYRSELVGDLRTGGAAGDLTLEEALLELLRGTGLTYRYIGDNAVTIMQAPAARDEQLDAADRGASRPQRTMHETSERRSLLQRFLRLAQSESPAPGAGPAEAIRASEDTATGDRSNFEEIVVTGSRVARPSFDMPTPVTVVSSQQIQQSGFNNIADLLTQLPSVGLGTSLSTGQFSDDAGAAFVNLRGLGTARTLVLINGRRRVAGASDSAATDLSTIPPAMIERIELITGGASAVYGADAVSGVINIILKKDFSGVEISGQGGVAEHGGGETFSATLLAGSSFADARGSFSLGLSHVRNEPLFSSERSFTNSWLNLIPNPDNTGPADGIPDMLTVRDFAIAFLHPGGAFNIDGVDYTVDPQLRPINLNPQTGLPTGGDGWDFTPYFQQRLRADTTAVRGNFNYRLTERVEFFVESEFSHGTALGIGAPNYDFGDRVLFRDNPYIPADLGAVMDGSGLTELGVSRASVDQGLRDDDNSRNSYSILAGLQGSIGEDWQWQAFAQYGRYELTSRERNQRITSRYLEAIDAIADPDTGNPVCRSEAARAAGCQPLNILGSNVASADALAYYRVDRTLRVDNSQTLAGAQLTGSWFDLPAGPLASAIGVEYREDTRSYRDDPLADLGLLYDKAAGTSLAGEDSVSEAFLELVAPLLQGKPFAYALQLEGAVRLSDYDSIGSTTAWKYGGSWAPTSSVKFRGTKSRSVRAPNLYELFAPRQISMYNMLDPCEISQVGSAPNRRRNCLALGIPEGWEGASGEGVIYAFNAVGGGNPQLNPETSDAWTAGLVITPQSLPGLSIAIDYWKIEIEGAVQALDVSSVVERCVDSASIDNVFCPRVTRTDDYAISLVDYSIVNVGSLTTDGVDIQAMYGFTPDAIGLRWPGRFAVLLNATYLRSLEQLIDSNDATSLLIQRGRYDNPAWRGTLSLAYANEAWNVDLSTRVIGKARLDMQASLESFDRPRVSTRIYNDLSIGYDLTDSYGLRLTVNNLFDVEPPMTAYTYLGGNSSLYDSIGRYFVVGASAKF